jgi:hypothetical protein
MSTKKMAGCHPDRPHHARGFCNACYRRFVQKAENEKMLSLAEQRGATLGGHGKQNAPQPIEDPPPLNTFDFAVTDHIVRLLLKHAMDFNKVIEEICPAGTVFDKGRMLDQLQTDIRIKTALQRDLAKLGLDDKAKEHYITELWRWFHNEEDPRLRATAARILGKAFIADRVETTNIETLPIADFNEGIKRMLGQQDPPALEPSIEGDQLE